MAELRREEMVMSHLRVRRVLGYLGFSLPVLLLVGGLLDALGIRPTISDFYHSLYRDFYVGTLCAIGVFLLAYKGHSPLYQDMWDGKRINDNRITNVAGISALGMAFFPNQIPQPEGAAPLDASLVDLEKLATIFQHPAFFVQAHTVHYLAALCFFASLAVICLKQFSRTRDTKRRKFYRGAGWIIVAMLAATAVSMMFRRYGSADARAFVENYRLIFLFEAIGTWAFASAWLVKGEADLAVINILKRPTAESKIQNH